ncbi:MAG: 50S ribosomal protein L29 [Acidobacteria bacterium]|nr:50S ribosomal protein L29 [Acidobacteriota bacterium]
MKASELRELTPDELQQKEEELADQLFALRLQKSIGQLEKPSRIRKARVELARVLTVRRERATGTT